MSDATLSSLESIALLLVGWLLGTLSPAIVDAIKRRRENALGREAILGELNEIAHRLALARHSVIMHRGKVNRQALEWLKKHLENYAGVHEIDSLMKNMRTQLSWPDAQITDVSRATAGEPNKGLTLQKYAVPLLDARVSALWSFNSSFTRKLLDIRANIDLLNDIVDRSRHYSDMTFGSATGDNHRRAVQNVEDCYVQYAQLALSVVDKITELRSLS